MRLVELSKNFHSGEFFRASSGKVTEKDIEKARRLCVDILQPLRDFIGRAVIITSGKRSPAHNQLIGGSITSDHLYFGKAAAADFTNSYLIESFNFIRKNCDYGQLIIYPDRFFIHVSLPTEKHHRNALVKKIGYPYATFSDERDLVL